MGEWKPARIANKDFEEGVQLASYDSYYVGYELWIVNNGTIFDNILVTDDLEYAKAQGEKLWRPTSKGEKEVKEKWDKENKPAEDVPEDDAEPRTRRRRRRTSCKCCTRACACLRAYCGTQRLRLD